MEAAAISIASNALNLVVKTATTAITNEIGLLLGVQEEMFFIKEELDMMQAFLEAASTEKAQGVVVNRWIKQVQELAFDVEDCLQEASIHMMKTSCLPFMCSAKKQDDIARKIRVLKTRIEDVSKRNLRYNLINKDNGGYPDESASSISMANVALLVGLDEPKRKLVELISREHGKVISVVGMGGLGKTTLARELYGCQELRAKFERFAWVTVLHPFNTEEFIESLAKQISDNPVDNKSELLPKKTTKEQVTEYLKDNKYLIVLDDLCHMSEWAKINDVLPKGNERRIIITTRLRPLAESISDTSDSIYVINKLSEEDALNLFYKVVYKTPNYNLVIDDRESKDDLPDENNVMKSGPSNTDIIEEESEMTKQCITITITKNDVMKYGPGSSEIMEQESQMPKQCITITITKNMNTQANLIINSCGQLPLAIVTIGSYLATKPKTSDEWTKLHKHLSTELNRNPDLGVVKNVLASSYDRLPYHLKPSLLYLSVFHNHKEIRRSRIIRRWMADGYVTEGRKKTAVEVGKDYFHDLMGRSLIQPSQTSTIVNGDFKRCNVHDIMYELILAKAMDENIVSLLEDESIITMTDNVRHLVIAGGSCTGDKVQERMQLSHMRSLSIFGKVGDYLSYPRMKLVRVLDLEGTLGLNNGDLKNVCKLRLLKYLGLRGTNITKLPDSLGKLSELETLDIKYTDVEQLPTGLTKLHKLSYLCAGDYYSGVRAPRGIGANRSLNILGYIDIGRSKSLAKEMQNLTNLSKLAVKGFFEENANALANVIDRLRHLRSLVLKAEYEDKDITCSALKRCVDSISYSQRYLQSLGSCLDSLCFPDGSVHSPGLRRCLDSVSSPPKYLQSLKLSSSLDKLPDWISSLENLEKIHFSFTRLIEIEAIKKLPNLKILNMGFRSIGETEELSFGEGTFPMLQVMILDGLLGLKSVSIKKTALKRLEQLKIDARWDITYDGVSGLEFLEQLKEMEVKVLESERGTMFVSNLQEKNHVLRVLKYDKI